jgi:cell wall-associated NlpC family hydrolase
VLGKLYNDCAATILDTVAGEDGDWYEIKSGSVRGYIKAEYFITGDEAEARAIEIGKLEGYVNTNGLRLRSEPNLDSQILTLLYSGETYQVLEVGDEFVKVQVDDEIGYVYGEMIDVSVKFDTAISLEEEKAKEEEEARKKAEAAAAAKKLEEAKKAAAAAAESAAAANQSSQSEASGSSTTQETTAAVSTTTTSVSSASRDALVSYAKQWVGVTPYVYGGTSLTTGADCSGFIQACYANALGMSVPRDSRSQASGGTEISESELQPGDLVFYNGGGSTINHVAMYIGGGQVVHASNASVGTIISNMKYREPCKYVRYIN